MNRMGAGVAIAREGGASLSVRHQQVPSPRGRSLIGLVSVTLSLTGIVCGGQRLNHCITDGGVTTQARCQQQGHRTHPIVLHIKCAGGATCVLHGCLEEDDVDETLLMGTGQTITGMLSVVMIDGPEVGIHVIFAERLDEQDWAYRTQEYGEVVMVI